MHNRTNGGGFMQNANAKELVKRVAMFEKAFDVVLQI
jgi:hypothetical protein